MKRNEISSTFCFVSYHLLNGTKQNFVRFLFHLVSFIKSYKMKFRMLNCFKNGMQQKGPAEDRKKSVLDQKLWFFSSHLYTSLKKNIKETKLERNNILIHVRCCGYDVDIIHVDRQHSVSQASNRQPDVKSSYIQAGGRHTGRRQSHNSTDIMQLCKHHRVREILHRPADITQVGYTASQTSYI
jgi:hypothetical protein